MTLHFTRTPGGQYIARTGTRDYKIGRINSHSWQLTIYAGTTQTRVVVAHNVTTSTKTRAVAIATAFEQLGDNYQPKQHDGRDRLTEALRAGHASSDATQLSEEATDAPQATDATGVTVRVSAYEVCALPVGHRLFYRFVITVRNHGGASWSVRHGRTTDGPALSRDGAWEYEQGRDLDDEWLGEHRFTLAEALEIAKVQAPLVQAQGYTVAEVLAAS
jgi:hypothetical protein